MAKKTTKFVKVFSLESFPLYSILRPLFNNSVEGFEMLYTYVHIMYMVAAKQYAID